MNEKPSPSDIFSDRLKKAREIRRLNQSDLAMKAGMPASSIAHFEAGSRKPSFDSLRRIANALEVTTDYLLGRAAQMDLAQAGDPMFRDIGMLSDDDREIAKGFLEMLAQRNARKEKDP